METHENEEQIKETDQEQQTEPDEFSYKGYEVVRGAFFAHLFEPSVKLARETVSVNSACIRRLPDTEYVQFLVNRDEKKLAVKPCTEDTKDSFRWSTLCKDGKVRPKTISCKPFYEKIMKLMGWDPDARYRIMGKLIRTRTETLFVFDLKEPEMFKRKGNAPYTNVSADSFGKSAEEHQNEGLVSFCEDNSIFYLEKDSEESKAGTETQVEGPTATETAETTQTTKTDEEAGE